MFLGPQSFVSQGKKSAVAGGTVLVDTTTFPSLGGVNIAQLTAPNAIDVGSGSNGTTNRALIAVLLFGNNAAGKIISITSVTFNGVAMQAIGGPYANGTVGDIYIYGLVAPATGAHDLVVTFVASEAITGDVGLLSVVAADQAGGGTTFKSATSNAATSATNSVTITTISGEIAVAGHMSGQNYNSSGNNGTDIGHSNSGNVEAEASNYGTASGLSTQLTYTTASSGAFISAGCSIKAA